MKAENPKIVLLGNNSGNNLGDAAIMSSIMESFSKQLKVKPHFYVPSVKPKFISDNYGHRYSVTAVDAMPWTMSVRLFGVPTLYRMYQSDVALICDGIIFGKKLFNPTFNFLITLIFLAPWAKLVNCKLICHSCGFGPFPSKISKVFARYVMNSCDLITVRDEDSRDLAIEIGVPADKVILTGDAAVVNPVSDETTGHQVLKTIGIDLDANPGQKILGINITRYLDEWLYNDSLKVADKDQLIKDIAGGALAAINNSGENIKPVVFSTQPMDDDICQRLAALMDTDIISNSRWLSHDIQAAMRFCGLFVGMRVHSLYLSSAVGCPVIGLIYAPKVRSYMKQLESQELGIELKDITQESFAALIEHNWQQKAAVQARQQPIVEHVKAEAERGIALINERYFSQQI